MTEHRKITGVRLNKAERDALQEIGNGSISKAIKQAITMLFAARGIDIERSEIKNRRTRVIELA